MVGVVADRLGAVSCVVNSNVEPGRLAAPVLEARVFHRSLPGYRPTPVHDLPSVARELGLARVGLKDESDRLGLPAFKVLGASWAIERTLRERPDVHTLVVASAGNHGRAVAHEAARRGLRCRVVLPARSARARRDAIAREGAGVEVVDGDYEAAVDHAASAAHGDGVAEIADVGRSDPARWVIDGYATLFSEVAEQGSFDAVLVPVGVGSLAAAAARFAARAGARVVGVEPASAACLTASLAAGRPVRVATPGTSMAGMDCAEVSPAAWRTLRRGVHGALTVEDVQASAAMRELARGGLPIGECGAAPLAALRTLVAHPDCAALREALGLDGSSRVLLLATEGLTNPEPDAVNDGPEARPSRRLGPR